MRLGPSKPITDAKSAAAFVKALARALERHFPTTSERLMDVLRILRRAQARDSDGSPKGRDREDGLDGEAATARAEGIAQPQSGATNDQR